MKAAARPLRSAPAAPDQGRAPHPPPVRTQEEVLPPDKRALGGPFCRTMKPRNPLVNIFRAGRHTAMDGRTISFTEADLANCAAAYDPSKHEAPAVIGHPKDDAPAYGWVKGLATKSGELSADFGDDMDAGLVELVRAGRFKKVSASFYEPGCPINPVPGTYYLRHVGFLGAQPPAVKGLKPIAFGASDEGTIEFQEPVEWSWVLSTIARLFRGWRDSIIADKGLDEANKIVADWDIQAIEDAAVKARPDANAFSEPQKETEDLLTAAEIAAREAALAQREEALKGRETAVGTKEASFAEAEKKTRGDADVALLDQLVKDGKLAPAAKPGLIAFMADLDATGVVSFGEGDAAPKQTPREFFRDLLSKSGTIINFGEASKPNGELETPPSDPAAFGEMLSTKATIYIAEQQAKGITVSPEEAVRHVEKELSSK